MRPLLLRMQAFGSFPGPVEVDFDALAPRGLFVVSGPTGAGKTTIFDAMCWALFGEMPLKEAGGVRSDHAEATVETFVELTFEVDGDTYVVHRTPTQLRPARRGGGLVEEAGAATLVRVDAAGTEAIATKLKAVNDHCKELVGLDAEQFQRVVLLPQGECARFLLAGSKERETLLGALFGGAVFDRVVDELRRRDAQLQGEVGDADRAIAERAERARGHLRRVHAVLDLPVPPSLAADPDRDDDVEPAARDEIGARRDAVAPGVDALQAEAAELATRADEAAARHAQAQQDHELLARVAALRSTLAELDDATPAIEAAGAAADRSHLARPVATASDAHREAVQRREAARAARDARAAAATAAATALGIIIDTSSATTISVTAREQETEQQALAARLEAVATAEGADAEARQAVEAVDAAIERDTAEMAAASSSLAALDELLPQLAEQAIDPSTLEASITAAEAAVAARRQLEAASARLVILAEAEADAAADHARVLARFVATQAPRLAADLADGEPCPVCGSPDHPSPARAPDGPPADFAEVEAASARKDAAARQAKEAEHEVTALRTTLGADVDTSPDELAARVEAARAALAGARRAHEDLAARTAEREAARARIAELTASLAALGAQRGAAIERAADAAATLEAAREAATGLDPGAIAARGEQVAALVAASQGIEDLFTACAAADGDVASCEQARVAALAASPFAEEDEARAALLADEDEARHLQARTAHAEARATTRGALAELEAAGLPEAPPDLEATATAARATAAARGDAAQRATTAANALADAGTELAAHDELATRSGELRERAALARRAHQVCSRGGALGMPLRRWVLGRELDRVTAAANVHLARLTGDHYALRRAQEATDGRRAFGLDLEVLDAQTGRPRSPRSLSGGEQFQASLALALGLADVVSHGGTASGRRFEALFVDEGFGSLDPDALDEAIEALHQLHATGRMVGAITHVEAMKQQLHVGIEVRRREDGRGSTLVVQP